jgi:hypothetical protein
LSIWLAAVVIAGSVAFVVALMLLIRARLAPPGGHFRDSDRASGVFAFVGAGFAILLGFVILLSFEGYTGAKGALRRRGDGGVRPVRGRRPLPTGGEAERAGAISSATPGP